MPVAGINLASSASIEMVPIGCESGRTIPRNRVVPLFAIDSMLPSFCRDPARSVLDNSICRKLFVLSNLTSGMLCLDERQHPVFQVQMHMRTHVPFLKIVPLDAVLAKLRVAKPKLIFAHVIHFVAPIAVGRSAANDECFHKRIIPNYFQSDYCTGIVMIVLASRA
jgi:hypothetical protein